MRKKHYTNLQWAILILRDDYRYTYRQISERLKCSMCLVRNVIYMSRELNLKPLIIKENEVDRGENKSA